MSQPITPNELKRLYPGASASTIARNSQAGNTRIRAGEPERPQGSALDGGASREAKGGDDAGERYKISFRIFALRPLDWDNYSVKQIQDQLITAGFLPRDDWRTLRGEVDSEKVYSEEEERTEITIERLT